APPPPAGPSAAAWPWPAGSGRRRGRGRRSPGRHRGPPGRRSPPAGCAASPGSRRSWPAAVLPARPAAWAGSAAGCGDRPPDRSGGAARPGAWPAAGVGGLRSRDGVTCAVHHLWGPGQGLQSGRTRRRKAHRMLVIQPARKRPRNSAGRIGLAVAGGGPIRGMSELGALDVAIEGLDLTRLDVYVGVSSGAFLAAGLANRLDTAGMCRIFITGDSPDVKFRPEMFLRPAFGEYLRRAVALPGLAVDWCKGVLRDPAGSHLADLLGRVGSAIPTGLFDNSGIERFLQQVFTLHGRSNDFRELDARLYVVAVDLDSGQAVRFGSPGWDDVPISLAVQASSALPGLYPPVDIRGHHFVDGALRRTMHASAVLDHGIDLMIGVNPFVPYNARHASDSPRQ